jgi:hypothetical protein
VPVYFSSSLNGLRPTIQKKRKKEKGKGKIPRFVFLVLIFSPPVTKLVSVQE